MAFLNTNSNVVPKEDKLKKPLIPAPFLRKNKPLVSTPTAAPTAQTGSQKSPFPQVQKPQANKSTGLISAPTQTPKPLIANSSTQNIDAGSAARAVYNAGQMTDWEQAAARNAAQAKGLQNYGQFAPFAEAKFYGVGGQSGGNLPDLQLPDLAGRGPQNTELFNRFANLYGSQANIGLQAAQTAAQRGLAGATSVLGAATPQLISPGQTAYNPLTGQNVPGIGGNPFSGGVQQGLVDLGQQYASNVSVNNQAKNIKNSIQSYLTQNPALNPSDFTDVNRAIQFLSGKTSDPRYQTLSSYLNEYISTLAPILGVGGDVTNLKTEIAQSMINGGASAASLVTVLNNIEKLAEDKLRAQLESGTGNFSTPTSGSTGSTGSSGGTATGWFNFT